MSFVVVIPARYQSARLPGKPLLDIAGKPMILHVVERARRSAAAAVTVATDDSRIQAVCEAAGVPVCMTAATHQSGTDRIEEVTRLLGLPEDHIVVNVQGDEPMVPPEVINQVADNLRLHAQAGICTLYEPLRDAAEFHNPNIVKLVTDGDGYALYFSRAPIPWPRDEAIAAATHQVLPATLRARRHVGLYAYRVSVLRQFVRWPAADLEQCEKLEQLRAMCHGVRIHADLACVHIPPGVDTEADLFHVRALLQEGSHE